MCFRDRVDVSFLLSAGSRGSSPAVSWASSGAFFRLCWFG